VAAGALVALAQVVSGNAGVQSPLFLLTLPGVLGLVVGAHRSSRRLLVLSGVGTVLALVTTALVGLVAYRDSAFVAFAAVPLVLVPLPVVAAGLAVART
jgi:quinol-cytochrome oxidoreductase complex cytochrome b subunit